MAKTLKGIPDHWSRKFAESLSYATFVLSELETAIAQLKEGLEGAENQVALYWVQLMVIMKEDKLKALVDKLATARSQLHIDIGMHIALVKSPVAHMSHLPVNDWLTAKSVPYKKHLRKTSPD